MTDAPPILAHVVATLGFGGTEVTCRDMVRQMEMDGSASSHIVAIERGDGALEGELAAASGRACVLLPGQRGARLRAFRRLLRQVRPDGVLFHCFNTEQALLAGSARLAGIRRIVCKAGNPAPARGDDGAQVWRGIIAANRLAGCRIVSSSRWIQRSLEVLGRLPEGSRVIHNACAINEFAGARVERANDRPDALRLGMVARLDPIKDHATLLSAVARVSATHGEGAVTLDLIGDGALREVLVRQAQQLGIADRVSFRGTQAGIAACLAELDAFVMSTTDREGFGIAVIEALAAGLPVIASDVPACREVLQDGALGVLVPAGNAEALAEEIGRLVTRRQSGQNLPAPDAAAVADAYGLPRLARQYLEALRLSPAPASNG